MSEAREAVAERARRRTRLAELGLDEEDLTISVVSSAAEAARWTPNHPKTARGLMRWIGLVAAARQQLGRKGWVSGDDDNYPTIANAACTIAIAFAPGDANTGTERAPQTPPRGRATERVIDVNQALLADHFGLGRDDTSFPRDARYEKPQTWLLLHFEDERSGELRLELSLPAAQNVDGSVSSWTERIVFPPITSSPTPVVPADEQGSAIEIPVQRRVN
jgi:hypothetical protein